MGRLRASPQLYAVELCRFNIASADLVRTPEWTLTEAKEVKYVSRYVQQLARYFTSITE